MNRYEIIIQGSRRVNGLGKYSVIARYYQGPILGTITKCFHLPRSQGFLGLPLSMLKLEELWTNQGDQSH